jgi:hypothetical protein
MMGLIRRSPLRTSILGIVVVTAVAACSLASRPAAVSSAPSWVAASFPVATPKASTMANASIAAGPPAAALAAEGGDPTDGQLGTYTWGDGGSDAPWLPGTRMAVGSGEPLTVSFLPETAIEAWAARAVPSTADGPAGATALGQGAGPPRFAAPAAGTWTVEVNVVFANAAGKASYFWQLGVD